MGIWAAMVCISSRCWPLSQPVFVDRTGLTELGLPKRCPNLVPGREVFPHRGVQTSRQDLPNQGRAAARSSWCLPSIYCTEKPHSTNHCAACAEIKTEPAFAISWAPKPLTRFVSRVPEKRSTRTHCLGESYESGETKKHWDQRSH